MKFDLIIFGGGTSGISAAYIASKLGLNTLLVEATDVLGGAITQGLVVPVMKLDSEKINTDFYADLLSFAEKYNANITYTDGNTGWFNPELLKIVFDDMLKSVKTKVLFSTRPNNISFDNNTKTFAINLRHKLLSLYIEANYIVDATANGEIFKLLNCNFQTESDKKQSASLRFILSGINLKEFGGWLLQTDNDRNVTTVANIDGNIHLSTACTWDTNKKWALSPLFKKAIENGDIEYEDSAYFQVFTVPSMPNSLAVNAPRIILNDEENLLDPFVYSRALIQGRERIYRLYEFCKKYFKGFKNSYIAHISDMLGVRESYRVKGKYTYKTDDIINNKCFDNIAFACNYPIDIHSNNKNDDSLKFSNHTYHVPVDALISDDNERLYGIGRIISTEFEAQAALRTQMSCFSMGEAASKDIFKKLKAN